MKITRLSQTQNASNTPNVIQLSTTSCETIYSVGGVKVRLGMIVGGTPALSFYDHSYTVRFPKVEQWNSDKHWNKAEGKYDFQNANNIQGPTYDVLPEGIVTLQKFVEINTAKKDLAEKRYENLPIGESIFSKRVLDKEDRRYVQAKLEITRRCFSPVGMTYGDKNQIHLLPSWWKKADEVFGDIFKKHMYNTTWDELTEEEYQSIVKMLDIYLDYFQ